MPLQFSHFDNPIDYRIMVKDDYIERIYCKRLYDHLSGKTLDFGKGYFPWFATDIVDQDHSVAPAQYNFQLSHVLFETNMPESRWSDIVQPIVDKIDADFFYKIKANLNPCQGDKIVPHGYHIDTHFPGFTSILYLNDCDGKTIIKGQDNELHEIESKAGRFVTFDNRVKHTGTSATDTDARYVINFNYYIHDKSKVYDRV